MFNPAILLLGLALAMDAAVVSFALGLLNHAALKGVRVRRGLITALVFGFFQFAMLWLGSYGGFVLSFSRYGHLYQLTIAVLFFMIAAKFVQESLEEDKKVLTWGIVSLLLLGLATSVDSLAAGVSLGTLPMAYLTAMDIGIITFLVCGIFYTLSQFLKNIPEKWLLRLGALIFVGLGANIIWIHVLRRSL